MFLHRFQERALDLGGRAVDFIGQKKIGKDRALFNGELAVFRIINLGPDQIGRAEDPA